MTDAKELREAIACDPHLLAMGGTIHPCVPLRESWWRKVLNRLAALAPIATLIKGRD